MSTEEREREGEGIEEIKYEFAKMLLRAKSIRSVHREYEHEPDSRFAFVHGRGGRGGGRGVRTTANK